MPPIKTKGITPEKKVPEEIGSQPRTEKASGTGARPAMGDSEVAAIFKMARNPVRRDILLTLVQGERGVGELSALLDLSQPAISHHLALLRVGGLVSARRQGKQNHYSLTEMGRQVADFFREIAPGKPSRKRSTPTAFVIDPGLLDEVGGFVDDPEGWFLTPNPEFEGRRPVDLLGTPDEPRLRNRIAAAKLGMFS